MIALLWARGLLKGRLGRIVSVSTAVALVVAFVGALGSFVIFARTDVSRRAAADVEVDWQVKLAPGVSASDALAGMHPHPGVIAAQTVGYGDASSLESTTGGTVQTTGTGKIVGIAASYSTTFPGEIRRLVGANTGVLLAQQTAANLHAGPGDTILANIPGLIEKRAFIVSGVVDLPTADSFFQTAGASSASGPQAPPDNVMIIPLQDWQSLYHPETGSGFLQVHVKLPHHLPGDPGAAFDESLATRRDYEVRMAGAAVVGDNLGARLDSARLDATYGGLLFLFLGLPGIAVGIALIAVAAGIGTERRRNDQALLRARGASVAQLGRIAMVEATLAGVIGTVLGLALGLAEASQWHVSFTRGWRWFVVAGVVGLASTIFAVLVPALRDARRLGVSAARRLVSSGIGRRWKTSGVWVMAAAAAGVIWYTTRIGYKVVVATEGVPTISVNYLSLLGPTLAWIAGTILFGAAASFVIRTGKGTTSRLLRPLAGGLARSVSGWLARQRVVVLRAVLLLTLATAFAVSTSIFDASFSAQSHVDAELTNGSDVTAFAPQGVGLGEGLAQLSGVPGVRAVEPMQHRFAYVGNDLQDLFGIRPKRIESATTISDAYFAQGRAKSQLNKLARTPRGIFVSDETVKDFQLKEGDTLKLRLLDSMTHQYIPVTFTVLGVVREFPTAPTDSFLVANASYIASVTHSGAAETLLIRTDRRSSPATVASAVRKAIPVASGARVRDIIEQRHITATGLVAVDVSGLNRLELVFGLLVTLWAIGILPIIGFAERRRSFVILRSLGAGTRHIFSFIVAESASVFVFGVFGGAAIGGALGWILVKVLQGVFDPPPEHLLIPWGYFGLLALGMLGGAVLSVSITLRKSATVEQQALRDLSL